LTGLLRVVLPVPGMGVTIVIQKCTTHGWWLRNSYTLKPVLKRPLNGERKIGLLLQVVF